ncbi:hypothetical protein MAMMFC1_03139 [Methylomusa anaerophila]|jgi:hypothetical protein|uniref:Uncharacterized protein n=2 Tax=Methylomusa anaerophila TaxID=1930071 RepID=A0A348AMZ8_9FIRM|nr:hypothetical protein MAMMFC1_03139 [Methylomusa anaerophila]
MWISNNPRDNLIALAVLTGILAITGIVHLIKKHREKQEIERFRQRQCKQGENISKRDIIHLNKSGKER